MLLFLNKLTAASNFNNKESKRLLDQWTTFSIKFDKSLSNFLIWFSSTHSAIRVKLEEEKSFINLIESSRGL